MSDNNTKKKIEFKQLMSACGKKNSSTLLNSDTNLHSSETDFVFPGLQF
jgi:hypothetical protein